VAGHQNFRFLAETYPALTRFVIARKFRGEDTGLELLIPEISMWRIAGTFALG
jgi:hypothetical protein